MFSKEIHGDPLTADKSSYIKLDWGARLICDQMETYKDLSPEVQNCNAAIGWEEHLERIYSEDPAVDMDYRWWEYRGKSCTSDTKPPLVICFYEFYNTIWQRIADREGLVIVAFEYHRNLRLP